MLIVGTECNFVLPVNHAKGFARERGNVDESTVTFSYETEDQVNEVKSKLKSLGYPEDGKANTLGSKAKSYVSCAIGKMS